ncbi:MAG: rhodanese-like domain-containing protein, partial [Actinomycetota bacterium]|nr:rhodanese-like domain-containing protein [Actinomycetota bacterium]
MGYANKTEATPQEVREVLLAGSEIALIDVRSEAEFALGHPLFAAQLPLDRIGLEAAIRFPRRDVAVVLYGAGEGDAVLAALRFKALGYTDVRTLGGG